MTMSLHNFTNWLIGAFMIISGYVPATYEDRKPDKSQYEAPKGSEAPVPETMKNKGSHVKKHNIILFEHSIKGERSFQPIIQRAALRYDIDPALVKAIIMAESEYNPRAISVKGAKGLMQLMPVTARTLGVDDVFNPEQNIHAGVRYFKSLLKQFDGDVKLALAAYNAGTRHVKRYNAIPPFKETRRYLKKVFRYYEFYKEKG